MSESLFDIGFFKKDSFLLQDISSLSELDINNLPHYKKRNDNQDRFKLVSYQTISDNFETYILFDEYYSEAGSYVLYTVDSLGYLINLIELKGGDGLENGGYFTNSEFINSTLILNKNTEYLREKSESGSFLNTWQLNITEVKYSISESGEIYIESESETKKFNQTTF